MAVETSDGEWEIGREDGGGNVGVEGKTKVAISLERKILVPKDEDEPMRGMVSGKGEDGHVRQMDTRISS